MTYPAALKLKKRKRSWMVIGILSLLFSCVVFADADSNQQSSPTNPNANSNSNPSNLDFKKEQQLDVGNFFKHAKYKYLQKYHGMKTFDIGSGGND